MTLFLAAIIGSVLAAAGLRMRVRGRTRPLHRRSLACLTAVLPFVGLLIPVVVGVAVSSPIASANPPSVVTDVNPDSTASGTLFGGRIEAYAVDPANTNIVFAASEDGGLWKSTDNGSTWSHEDQVLLTAMSDVQFAPSDSNLVIATGAYDGSTDNRDGGIWLSTDGGTTWAKAHSSNLCTPISANDAYKIAIDPVGTHGNITIFVGTDCGLAESTNSGATWTLNQPSGNAQFLDVQVRPVGGQLQVDACGYSYFASSPDGGATWPIQASNVAGATSHVSIPTLCSIATAPSNPNIVFFTALSDATSNSPLMENDDGGVGAWHNLNVSSDGNGRPSFVVTVPGFDGVPTDFEVFYGTNSIVMHQTCTTTTSPACTDGTNAATATGSAGTSSGSWSVFDGPIRLLHNSTDPATLAIDPTTGCPSFEGGDPGIFKITNGCTSSPTFTDANDGDHAAEIYSVAGTAASGHTDLYYGMQDNGLWSSTDGGTTWCDCVNADVPQVLADRTGPPSSVFFQQDSGLHLDNEAVTSGLAFTPPPPVRTPPPPCPCGNAGSGPAAQFGYQSYAIITSDGLKPPTYTVWVTTNAGTAWTQMGNTLPGPPTGRFPIEASGSSSTPTFYLNLSVLGTPTLYSLTGPLNNTATLTPLNSGLGSAGAFNVNPANPLELYAVDNSGAGAVKFSTNGGASWQTDTTLTTLVTQGGVYPFENSAGGDITAFAFDPNSNTILAGTNFTGIYGSVDGGAHWFFLPGSQEISRVTSFFFDGNNPGTSFVGSYGRGIWQIVLPAMTATSLSTSLSGGGQSGTTVSAPPSTAFTDSANLTGTNAGEAVGSVTYTVYSDSSCTVFAADGGTKTVTGGVVPDSNLVSLSTPGTYYWQASYSGDAYNDPSTSTCGSEIEYVQAPTVTTTALPGGSPSVIPTTPMTDTATLTGVESSEAGGTMTYTVYSDSACSVVAADGGTMPVTGGVVPDSNPVALSTPGIYYWQASFSGDKLNETSHSTCGSEIEYVQAPTVTTTALRAGSPKVLPDTPTTDAATLTGLESSEAGGTMTYTVYSDSACTVVAAGGGTKPVTGGVVPASNPVALITPGTYYWQASFSGDKLNEPSESTCGSEIETVIATDVSAVVQISTSPSYAGDPVNISSSQLQASCEVVTYETLQKGSPSAPTLSDNSIPVVFDGDGNVTVVVNGGDCAPGDDLIEADLTVAPYITATTTLVVAPPQVTAAGVTGFPADEVETGNTPASGNSDVYTVFEVETDPVYAEQTVEISSPELLDRCGQGSRWESNAAAAPFLNSATATATLDDDGNAVFVFKGASCAAGPSTVIADVLAGTHPTYITTYTIAAPVATLVSAMVAAAKKHRHRHPGSGATTPPDPPAMTVTASPDPIIEAGE